MSTFNLTESEELLVDGNLEDPIFIKTIDNINKDEDEDVLIVYWMDEINE